MSAYVEALVGYYPSCVGFLTRTTYRGGETVSGGQFDWGGRLLKGNGGAQRFPQNGWKSFIECKGIRELDCETYKSSRVDGLSDPVVPHGRAIAQRIKLPGDNRLISPRVHIDGEVWHLDVGSSHPGAVVGPRVGLFAH